MQNKDVYGPYGFIFCAFEMKTTLRQKRRFLLLHISFFPFSLVNIFFYLDPKSKRFSISFKIFFSKSTHLNKWRENKELP